MEPTSPLTEEHPVPENSASQREELFMDFEVLEDRRNPGDWRVEAMDFEDEGKVYVAIFSGPDAKERAHEYASFKNSEAREPMRRVS